MTAGSGWGISLPGTTLLDRDPVGDVSTVGARRQLPPGTRLLAALLVAVVVTQRVGLPAGGFLVPVVIPVGLAVAGWLLWTGALRVDALRGMLLVVATGAMALAAWLATWRNSDVRLTALLLVLAVVVPWALRCSTARNRAGARYVGIVFVRTVTVLAAVGIAQMAAQLAGVWRYRDLLAAVVPSQLLIADYNTSQPVTWDSDVIKSQAIVLLEASVFSQLTALAIVVALLLRRPAWQVLILGVGLLTALSGTGLILLGAGLALLVLRDRSAIRPAYLAVAVIAVAVAVATPAGDLISDRSAELDQPTSSLALRFVLPYEQVSAGMAEDQARWLVGAGPGSSDRLLESDREGAGLAVVYTLPAKALFEYGLLAGAALLLFLAVGLLRAPPYVVLPGTMLVMLTLLGGYLGQPYMMWLAWLLSVVWGGRD